jgi:cysteine desulfurase/selenocysteine lyase
MTTPTTISDGLLDEATLAALANQFFAALPGSDPGIGAVRGLSAGPAHAAPPAPGASAATSAPATPGAAESAARSESSAAPAAGAAPSAVATPGVPAPERSAAAGAPPAAAVPGPYAAALPRVGSPLERQPAAPVGAPSHPYYFLAEASALQSEPASFADSAPATAAAAPATLQAQPFGLPGEARLRALLASMAQARDPAAGAPASTTRASHFYFLDAARDRAPNGAHGFAPDAHPAFDVQAVRRDFPILAERVQGQPLIWFDNAATTHKPQAVIDRLAYFYAHENSNIHRAAHELAARATDAYESARSKVARFLGASSSNEIIFVRGATEGINLVAQSWGRANIGAGDEIVVSHLEHHANIVPWLQLVKEKGAKLRVIPVDDSGQILIEDYRRLLNDRTRMVAVSQVSNALGTITPVAEITELAHRAGARVLIDGAQAVSHLRVNVQALQADFYVFSGHKVFAPTGIGVVFGKADVLESMPPWQGGGNMIEDVTFERATYQQPPARFEAGTGNIADAVGLGAALDYVERIGLESIGRYEHDLLAYATEGLRTVPGLRLIGTAKDKASVQSFVLDGYRPEEVGSALNREGIAVRAGHHCAQPIVRRFGLEATVRPSLAFYNTCAEIDVMIRALHRLASQNGRPRI